MSIKIIRRMVFAVLLPAVMISAAGCGNKNAELLPFYEESAASQVQSLSIAGMDKAETFAEQVCVIPEKQNKGGDSFSSAAQLCVNITDQSLIYADHIYDRLYPASVTKLFSAYVILKYGNLDDMVTISGNAANITEAGAKLSGMKEGEQYSLRSLLEIMLIYSGNDAALAAAEHVGGSEETFAEMMNEEAKKLGAAGSHFVNPHGLHNEDHYTTAYDIYLVLNELVKNKDFTDIVSMAECEVPYQDVSGEEKTLSCTSTNRFLLGTQKAPEGITVIGGKTGTTLSAGSCLAVYSKNEDENEYISVILKAGNGDEVFSQMSRLLEMCR